MIFSRSCFAVGDFRSYMDLLPRLLNACLNQQKPAACAEFDAGFGAEKTADAGVRGQAGRRGCDIVVRNPLHSAIQIP